MNVRLIQGTSRVLIIITADAVEALALVKSACIHAVGTSPPYNAGKKYGDFSDRLPWPVYFGKQEAVARQLARVLAPGGHIFLNACSNAGNPYLPYDLLAIYRQYFKLQNDLAWVKAITTDDGVHHSRFMPTARSPRFITPMWEPIFHFSRSGREPLDKLSIGVPYADESNVERFDHDQQGPLRRVPQDREDR